MHSTPSPTADQVRRFEQILEHGCIACRMRGVGNVWPEIHHLNLDSKHGGRRLGHDFTVGLDSWHHRGIPFKGMTAADTEAVAGPSFARTPRAFRKEFGRNERLLEYQNKILGQ